MIQRTPKNLKLVSDPGIPGISRISRISGSSSDSVALDPPALLVQFAPLTASQSYCCLTNVKI